MTRTIRVAFADKTRVDAPAVWVGKHCAAHRPAGANRDFPPTRGQWTITHIGSGMAAARLHCSKRDAIALARAWDTRIGTIDPADARNWPWRQAWLDAVHAINCPWQFNHCAADDGAGTDTAAELAATAGLPIDHS